MSKTDEYIKTTNYSTESNRTALGLVEKVVSGFQQNVASLNWGWLDKIAKSSILTILGKINRGELHIEQGKESWNFGSAYSLDHVDGPSRPLRASIKILKDSFWKRLFLHADFGFADSFMLDEVEVSSLNDLFRIFILNRQMMNEMSTSVSPFVRILSYIANSRLANSLTGSPSNISAHYDLPTSVFNAFLSRDLTYSCAIFDKEANYEIGDLLEERPIAPPQENLSEERVIPADDLERGQIAKLRLVAERARLKPGVRVLEIGCGWGSFAMLAASEYGAEVDTITISEEQLQDVRRRIEAAKLSDKIHVHFLDYRKLPPSFHHAFDAVVSIGVMEHVGIEFMTGWFKSMSWAMKREGSFKVFTMSTVPDTRWQLYSTEVDFVRKYIYPGGQLSSVYTLVKSIRDAGLNVNTIEDIGPHYARTLREWSYRFQKNFESHIKPAMKKQYPSLTEQDIDIFKRKFIYYYAYSEAGFAMRSISDHVFTLTREANLNL